MRRKFAVALLLLLLATGLQFQTGRITGLWINFVFSFAIVAALSLDFFEFLFLLTLSIFILNWQPILGMEITLVAILPLVVFFLKKFLPWHGWLNNLLLVFICELFLYLVIAPAYFFGNAGFFLKDVFASLIFGAIAFKIINK